ncbi:hypothetical protein ACKVMT_10040 [Halobacteriales archaeon Cl-PHB]
MLESLADLATTQNAILGGVVLTLEEAIRGRWKTERNSRYLTGEEEANRPGLIERVQQVEEQSERNRRRIEEDSHGC